MSKKFLLIGLGFIADRHISAIEAVGGSLVAGCDIDKSKAYKINGAKFYENWMKMLDEVECDYVVICTPNDLHAGMADYATNVVGREVICEKPPVITPGEYDLLKFIDKINIVLQCRYSEPLQHLKDRLILADKKDVEMRIEVHRDDWYMDSWKADPAKSGGLLYNIGCHYFDLLCWWFGEPKDCKIKDGSKKRIDGEVEFDKASVKFTVAIDAPIDKQKRVFKIGEENINLTQLGFESLHTKVYEDIIKGKGYKLKDFETAMNLIEKLYDSRKS